MCDNLVNSFTLPSGEKVFVHKDGSFATGKWVTVGDTKYYCDKSGVITKNKPAN